MTSIVRLDFSSIVVVSRYCPLLITEIIRRSAKPIGSTPLNAFDVGDSPVSVTVIAGPRSTVVSASIRWRSRPAACHSRIDDSLFRGGANLVLNPVVEIGADEQVVVAEFVRYRANRIRGSITSTASRRRPERALQQILFLVQCRCRPFHHFEVRHLSEAAFSISAAPGAAAAPPMGLDCMERLNEAVATLGDSPRGSSIVVCHPPPALSDRSPPPVR